MMLLPIYVSPSTCAHIHFRRCGFVFKAIDTFETSLWTRKAAKAVRDINKVQYDGGKYTDPYVSNSILHFV